MLSAVGAGLIVFEWRTRSSYRLLGLGLAVAATTFLLGATATVSGLITAFRYLAREEILGDALLYRKYFAIGCWESLKTVFIAAPIAAVQLIAWGLLWRTSAAPRRDSR